MWSSAPASDTEDASANSMLALLDLQIADLTEACETVSPWDGELLYRVMEITAVGVRAGWHRVAALSNSPLLVCRPVRACSGPR